DRRPRPVEIDATVVDDEFVELWKLLRFVGSARDRGEREHEETGAFSTSHDHDVESGSPVLHAAAECGHLQLPLTDADENEGSAVGFILSLRIQRVQET